ncbi:DUF6907 domain-containing protein [Streptomyces sp. TP-A0874]|uniref:DUF6907 domain-containing protein n=1 Tax=Streptomyces sp. TP-A0874 TaxID=549819 RepID=UPI0008533610|nr:hypothetical protein [Streptomyces sp. TP-A0874]
MVELPLPEALVVRDQPLTMRCVEQPRRKIVVVRGSDSADMSPTEVDEFADQLVSFAAQIRRLARLARQQAPVG